MLTPSRCSLPFAAYWLVICCVGSLSAQDTDKQPSEAISLENGLSPDRHKNIVFVWRNPPVEGAGICYVRNPETNKSQGSFAWSGFGRPYEVLWRPDSKAFAIKGEEARGYVQFRICTYAGAGSWRMVHHLDLVECVAKKYGLQVYGKGGSHPFKWLSTNRLVVDVYDRLWPGKVGGDDEQPYQVTLHLPKSTASLHIEATIESIQPVSDDDTLFPR